MKTHNPENERIKRQYFTYLKEAKRYSEASTNPNGETLMSAVGYQQTLDAPRCDVRLPLESRRKCHEIRKPCVLCPLTAQKQTPSAASADVWF